MLPRRRLQPLHPLPFLVPVRSFVSARVPWVRDRALDHAVEKEKHLLPYLNLKDLLLSPSSSLPLPLSSIAPLSSSLLLPFRPLRFLRLFPSTFLESFPSSALTHPHFSPSPPLLTLHSDELLAYSQTQLDSANRLLRLLMLSPRRRIPLNVIHSLRFDLALPRDFPQSLLPLFPDYFQLSPSKSNNSNAAAASSSLDLELVCYSHDLALSEMEKYAAKTGGYTKGMSLAFPLKYPRGFEMEKKVRKWVEEWQKLPYVSPYEDGSTLPAKSDVWEKWVVGMVHEFLSLLIGRKTEKGNLEKVAPHLGLPAGFRKLIFNHPGIFYVSNKLKTQTVVLREAYRRDLLVEKHPLMGMRYQYIHLMRERKEGSGDGGKKKKSKKSKKSRRGDEVDVEEHDDVDEEDDVDDEVHEDEREDGEEISEDSDFDTEDEESNNESDDDEEDYRASQQIVRQGPQGIQVEAAVQRGNFADRRQGVKTQRSQMQKKNNAVTKFNGRDNSTRGNRMFNPRKKVST